ncbi:putative FAD binding protein [Bombardia bombarda]|uniref:FAD binding protein n=1 Tax=Bombardia bombarda TaxID=252184 RepID=A0AA39X7I6_9PEZI|nr:putative FAD binding protein [Bombardia bombarda]
MSLTARMIQNFTGESNLEPHWGYASRIVPCKNDAGSCAYLDLVYGAHDLGMLYSGIFWATIGGILFKKLPPPPPPLPPQHPPHPPPPHHTPLLLRPIFGRTTRLQLLILAILTGYLAIWTFVGLLYTAWITPIKSSTQVNTRTALGPWADRVGILAYALTPLSVLLASRESLLSLLTGVPYTSFLFLHRWTGYIILAQSVLHTMGWCLVEARLYNPQPDTWNTFIAQPYAVWGVVALALLFLLWVLSLGFVIRRVTGYELFRKAHYVLAMLYIGAVIGHWKQLQCFLVPGLVLWFLDRFARLVRMGLLHYGGGGGDGNAARGWGFAAAQAEARLWRDDKYGDVVRLDFAHPQTPWKIGQHFFLCFTEGSLWQSHPFTPLSLPVEDAQGLGTVRHSYIFRAKGGETRKIAAVVAKKLGDGLGVLSLVKGEEKMAATTTTPVILQGPYGEDITDGLSQDVNVLCVAGGTGITYVLPVLLRLATQTRPSPGRRIELVWAVKREQDVEWVQPELDELKRYGGAHDIRIRIFVTDDDVSPSPSQRRAGTPVCCCSGLDEKEGADIKETGDAATEQGTTSSSALSSSRDGGSVESGRPDLGVAVSEFIGDVVQGSTRVFGSGPPDMIVQLRSVVAKCNSGAKVWKGQDRFDVRLVCDDRLEW